MLAGLVILLTLLETLFPLAKGYMETPPGFVFLGTVHHPADYFYYLSQFAQGAYRTLTTIDLYTAESVPASFVGWSNVLTGRIFRIIGVPPVAAYHISVAVGTVALMFAAYAVTRRIFRDTHTRTLSLYPFFLFHAFPLVRDGVLSYGDYFNNFAVPKVRFGNVPHQLLLNTASFIMVWCFLSPAGAKRSFARLTILAVASMTLASLQPALWLLVTGAGIVSYLLLPFLNKTHDTAWEYRPTLETAAVAVLSGLPPLLYLSRLFGTLPFTQLRAWEMLQQTQFTAEHFLGAAGPVFVMGIIGIPMFLRQRMPSRFLAVVFTVVSYVLFLSPVPRLLGLSHVRFMSPLAVFFVSASAASIPEALIASRSMWARMFGVGLLALLTALLIPNHLKTLELSGAFAPNNAYHYLPRTTYDFLLRAGAYGTPDDTYLITWPYNSIFPALTGKRSYHGHPLLTIQSEEKDRIAERMINGNATASERQAFFRESGVTYLLVYTDNQAVKSIQNITLVEASDGLSLYRVHNE